MKGFNESFRRVGQKPDMPPTQLLSVDIAIHGDGGKSLSGLLPENRNRLSADTSSVRARAATIYQRTVSRTVEPI